MKFCFSHLVRTVLTSAYLNLPLNHAKNSVNIYIFVDRMQTLPVLYIFLDVTNEFQECNVYTHPEVGVNSCNTFFTTAVITVLLYLYLVILFNKEKLICPWLPTFIKKGWNIIRLNVLWMFSNVIKIYNEQIHDIYIDLGKIGNILMN